MYSPMNSAHRDPEKFDHDRYEITLGRQPGCTDGCASQFGADQLAVQGSSLSLACAARRYRSLSVQSPDLNPPRMQDHVYKQ